MTWLALGILLTLLIQGLIWLSRIVLSKRKLWKINGYKSVRIDGVEFVIKKLTPLDFLEDKDGLPLTFFAKDKAKSLWGALNETGENEKVSKAEQERRLEVMKRVVKAGLVRGPGEVEDYFTFKGFKIGLILYDRILSHSIRLITKIYTLNNNTLLYYDKLSQRYGKLPHECLYMSKHMTEVEKFMFDGFVFGAGLDYEVTQAKKTQAKMRAKNGKR
jgi:hypothetical protein